MSVLETYVRLDKPGFQLDISCTVHGEITGVFGPSGSGKTTLLRLIAGLETPQSGHIRILDKEVFNLSKNINLPPEQRKIGYVFQEGRLFPHLNVLQNLRYGLKKKPDLKLFNEISGMLKIADLFTKNI